MQPFQQEFIRFALEQQALRFGEFTLKSGRVSPYFFNAGLFHDGASLYRLASFYARTLIEQNETGFMLYGPAYKGIPLAAATAIALSIEHGMTVPYAFNRKEVKDHGEGGQLVGAPLQGRVIIVDDVITAGISVGESVQMIRANGAEPGAVLIGLDRDEKTLDSEMSAAMRVKKYYNIQVYAVASMDTLIEYVRNDAELKSHLDTMNAYRSRFGSAN